MSGIWGEYLKLSIFGESHGKGIGVTVNGLPAGLSLDIDEINKELKRRKPGSTPLATARQEDDEFEIISGYFQGRTTGSPICCIIWNKDQHSSDYEAIKDLLRPGHADFTAKSKYDGFSDYRGGGHFSGRLTAPLVLVGAIAKQIIRKKGITIGSHILSIADIKEANFDPLEIDGLELLSTIAKPFPVLSDEEGKRMQDRILQAKAELDSIGGIVETAIVGLEAGFGSPFFNSMESQLAHLLFSIPAVKGIEFGAGFAITQMPGSKANDAFILMEEKIKTKTNHNGGIQGGITNGMPVIFRTAFKPTPSIAQRQKTVDFKNKIETEIQIKGRHDPCIVLRAVPVVEAMAAIALLDLMIEKEGTLWMK